MKVVILAGGRGSRISEETDLKPKPMVEVGGKPILWHIMQHYSHYGFNDFVLALGYRSEYIKRYVIDYCKLSSDLTIKLRSGDIMRHGSNGSNDWTVQLVDTGLDTQTGGRVKRLAPYIGNDTFMLTYGDGVSDVPVDQLLKFHRSHGKMATLTAVRPPARFGHMHMDGEMITNFTEKPQTESGWINGGFFVLEPQILDFIPGDETWFEREPLEYAAKNRQLLAYKHSGFWQCMDTLRDKRYLEELVATDRAPWIHDDIREYATGSLPGYAAAAS
ncbi:MAG: glucose-1-phosphate cytidylyltransferase [Anaerolineae bacterium]|nr:glucose-1-phosphate cytidylyltransferase [Phycisphaerae bacterium]